MNNIRKIGLAIKFYRLERDKNQDEVALASGIDRSYLSGIENGRRNVSLDVFLRLCTALDIPPWELLKRALGER